MRLINTMRLSVVAGAALFVAACGQGNEAANVGAANDLDSNLMLDEPGNDASAMESAANVVEPMPTANVDETANETAPPPSGGDAAADPVDSNISGM
jgi:hypothetical protein